MVYHSGVLGPIEDLGVDPGSPHLIVGTSAGAAVAASMRNGAAPDEIVEKLSKARTPNNKSKA